MPWFKVDDSMSDHSDVLDLLECRGGFSALGLWTLAGSWSARQLSDGFISRSVLRRLGGTANQAKLLVSVGLWDVAEGGYQFRNWLKYQPSRESVEAERAKAKARMAARRSGGRSPEQTATVQGPRPDPTRPDPTNKPPTPLAPAPGDPLIQFAKHWRNLTGRSEFKAFAENTGDLTGTEREWLFRVRKICDGSAKEFGARVKARLAEDDRGFLLKQTLFHWENGPLQMPSAPPRPKPPQSKTSPAEGVRILTEAERLDGLEKAKETLRLLREQKGQG